MIEQGIGDVNDEIGDYAALGALHREDEADAGRVVVDIHDETVQVYQVYGDIVEILIAALVDNNDLAASIWAGDRTNSIDLSTGEVTGNQVISFVQQSGLKGPDGVDPISGTDRLSALHDQTLTGVVVTVDGQEFPYEVYFRVLVKRSQIDAVIEQGIGDVNDKIDDYAAPGSHKHLALATTAWV